MSLRLTSPKRLLATNLYYPQRPCSPRLGVLSQGPPHSDTTRADASESDQWAWMSTVALRYKAWESAALKDMLETVHEVRDEAVRLDERYTLAIRRFVATLRTELYPRVDIAKEGLEAAKRRAEQVDATVKSNFPNTYARYQRMADKYPATAVGTGTLMAARALGVLTGTILGGAPMAMALVALAQAWHHRERLATQWGPKVSEALRTRVESNLPDWLPPAPEAGPTLAPAQSELPCTTVTPPATAAAEAEAAAEAACTCSAEAAALENPAAEGRDHCAHIGQGEQEQPPPPQQQQQQQHEAEVYNEPRQEHPGAGQDDEALRPYDAVPLPLSVDGSKYPDVERSDEVLGERMPFTCVS
jgi:hypothetical protein